MKLFQGFNTVMDKVLENNFRYALIHLIDVMYDDDLG